MKRLIIALVASIGVVGLLLPWWRNHALLLDFYDYGLVMAAAGRIELAERPYVDFLTPIQTLQFSAAVLAEWWWGARYLSLTYINAVFIVGSFAGLAALLWRRLGGLVAILVAFAIVVASSVQHTIIWYNAMGVTWLAVVVWLTASPNPAQRGGWFRLILVWVALWLGGMNKVTYQAAALAFAFAFTFRSACLRSVSWRTAGLLGVSFILFGMVAPVFTEIAFTGASLGQWLENVVLLPARYRTGMLSQIATVQFYLHTPHDYYKPPHFTYAGAWGIGLLLLTAGLVLARIRKSRADRHVEIALLGVVVVGAWICGAVLLATNMDIACLSGAAWLVLAAGLVQMDDRAGPALAGKGVRAVLGLAAVSLLIPAWLAAWQGARALWGHMQTPRAELVSTDELPERFNYIRGMRVLPGFLESVKAFSEKQDQLMAAGMPARAFCFVNGMEWMVRAVPEARHPGLPLWFAGGTTYSENDAPAMAARFVDDPNLTVIVSYVGWTQWYPVLRACFDQRYRQIAVGPRVLMYLPQSVPAPLEFALGTQSNVYSRQMHVAEGTVSLQVGANGSLFLGGRTSHRIDLPFPLYRLSGEMVGDFGDAVPDTGVTAMLRVYALEQDRRTDVLWEERVAPVHGERPFSRPFTVSTGGRAVSLVLELPSGFSGKAGWRKLWIEQAGPMDDEIPWPIDELLLRKTLRIEEFAGLFGSEQSPVSHVSGYGADFRRIDSDGGAKLAGQTPLELWFKLDHGLSRLSGSFGLTEGAWNRGGVRVCIVCYKSGRFDVVHRQDLAPQRLREDRQPQHFDVGLPEGLGWIGFVVTPLDAERVDGGVFWWGNVQAR